MNTPTHLEYFTSTRDRNFAGLVRLLKQLFAEIHRAYDLSGPVVSPDFSFDYSNFLENREIPVTTRRPKAVIKELLVYFRNCLNWHSPGTMLNVTPPANILAVAAATASLLFNPNLAEDKSGGLFGLCEMEVTKYVANLLGWDWKLAGGFSTFGGKATNTYATHFALKTVAPETAKVGVNGNQYFYVVSDRAHPCQQEICGFLGIGEGNCLVIPSEPDGRMNTKILEEKVRVELSKGRIFLGITVNAGTTIEYIVDNIPEIVRMVEQVTTEFALSYRPRIHADAVIGWVWSFFKYYDFRRNREEWDSIILQKLLRMHESVKALALVDSLGIDFHKTGFCPYSSSFFVLKNGKEVGFRQSGKYGEYSPYKFTLELSRPALGAFAALASIRGLGADGYIRLIGNLVQAAHQMRTRLQQSPHLHVLDENSDGLTCMFVLLPFSKNEFLAKKISLDQQEVETIQDFNAGFVEFIKERLESERPGNVYFSASRSYVEPGATVRLGAIKAYPMSPFLTGQQLDEIIDEILSLVEIYRKENASFHKRSREGNQTSGFHPIA